MKVMVLSDKKGRIISIGKPGDLAKQPSGIVRAGILPKPGQQVHHIDLPAEFDKKPLPDLCNKLRVDLKGKSARLVKV